MLSMSADRLCQRSVIDCFPATSLPPGLRQLPSTSLPGRQPRPALSGLWAQLPWAVCGWRLNRGGEGERGKGSGARGGGTERIEEDQRKKIEGEREEKWLGEEEERAEWPSVGGKWKRKRRRKEKWRPGRNGKEHYIKHYKI